MSSPTPSLRELQPAAAPRPALPPDALVGGLAFHRLVFARRRSAWWTPLVTGVLAGAFYLAVLVVGFAALAMVVLVNPELSGRLLQTVDEVTFDLSDPLMLAALLLTIVLMLPAYYFASLIVNGSRVGGKLRLLGRARGWVHRRCRGDVPPLPPASHADTSIGAGTRMGSVAGGAAGPAGADAVAPSLKLQRRATFRHPRHRSMARMLQSGAAAI